MISDTAASKNASKMRSIAGGMLLIASLLVSLAPAASAAPAATPLAAAQEPQNAGSLPLLMQNVGQYAGEARFLLKQGEARIWLTDDAVWLASPDTVPAGEQPGQPSPFGRRGCVA